MGMAKAMLFAAFLSGCAAPGASPAAQPVEPVAEIALTGCAVHQAIVQVAFDEARALVPEPFVVAPFPGAAPGAPGDPGSARMDAPFVVCERAADATGFSFFGPGVVVEPPVGQEGVADLHYFAFGLVIAPTEIARILASWGVAPLDVGPTTHDEELTPFRETRSESTSANGTVIFTDRLAPAEPLMRPSEIYRIHFSTEIAFDLLIEPHDAVLGEGTFRIEDGAGWLATIPAPTDVSTSAYAASPEWGVTIARVTRE